MKARCLTPVKHEKGVAPVGHVIEVDEDTFDELAAIKAVEAAPDDAPLGKPKPVKAGKGKPAGAED